MLAMWPEPPDAAIWAIDRVLDAYPVMLANGWVPMHAVCAALREVRR